jgi:CO/xanthine dehydrogenase Mo-binding subunit
MTSSTIGQSVQRVGGRERATGAQRYVADLRLEGVLHVKLVSLNCGRARILAIDAAEASRMEGVRCVLTAADLPQPMPRFGPVYADRPVLAAGETKFFGEPVAAVAAEDEDTAAAAAAAIRVEYEELPGVYTVEDALDPESPLVQDPSLRADSPFRETNTLAEYQFGWGDIENVRAEHVIENTYRFPMVYHFSIEPYTFLAAPERDGVAVWSAVQHPYVLQRVVAAALDLPVASVRVIAPDPGGGFGGKGYPKYEPLVAFLALRTGRPVRLALTLEESFQAARRAACRVRIRSGFDPDGRIVFQDIEANFLLGAYADIGSRVVSKSSYAACGPYRTPHARILGRGLLSHTTPSTAFRGFGVPQLSWALESQIDEAARRLGIDPLEIRLRNLPAKGETLIPGDTPADGDWAEALRKAAGAVGWGQPLAENRGRGLAIGLKNSASASISNTILRLHHDNSLSILTGTSDMGQGARTVLSQLAADELGIPVGNVKVIMGDTATVPFDASTSASRSTVFMGNAVLSACRDIKRQLVEMAAEVYELPAAEVAASGGCLHLPGKEISYEEVIRRYFGPVRGEIIAVGSARGRYLPDHPLGGKASFWEVVAVGCEVEVDRETGEYQVTKLATVTDVGKALNPRHVEAQDEGAAVMGLGHTMMEHLILDEQGRILNLGALDYRVPTIKDTPLELHSLLLENGDGPGPYGAKGTGESGILAIAPAVGSAVQEAAGVQIRELPLTPERVWVALLDNQKNKL